ncbi:DNA replication/repair protein RecF [Eionea flava]
MSVLKTLSVQSLRNLASVNIALSPSINIFYGDNGSGKTSILEAVALLGLGRSFRSHKSRSLIHHDKSDLTVFASLQLEDDATSLEIKSESLLSPQQEPCFPVGIQKFRNGSSLIKSSGEVVRSAALLAKQLPLLIINANSFQLIEGSPVQRRQFLDWIVFHVKPEFATLWRGLQKILKQRNSLLRRDKISREDLAPWDSEFIRLSEAIDQVRREVFDIFIRDFERFDTIFSLSSHNISMEYYSGWDKDQSIGESLEANFDRDCRDGYTHHGPQRAEIKIKAQSKPAIDVLSRGQEKALVCAMTITKAHVYQQLVSKKCVFLIDDLLAELDQHHSKILVDWLLSLNVQVLITGVMQKELLKPWLEKGVSPAVFHVKHGEVVLQPQESGNEETVNSLKN